MKYLHRIGLVIYLMGLFDLYIKESSSWGTIILVLGGLGLFLWEWKENGT